MKTVFAFCAAAFLNGSVLAQDVPDFSTLYDRATLAHWQESFSGDIAAMFREDILPVLSTDEQAVLGTVRLEFPAVGLHKGVFDFYSGGNVVAMPVVSLRFFGDLALAYSWLNTNGYNPQTIQQYIGMIHYQPMSAFPGGRYPRPLDALDALDALGIPANVRDDPRVYSTFSELFKTGIFFILGHELGHLRYGHPGYNGVDPRDARANEAQADAFALDLMRRKKAIPNGAMLWFSSAALTERHRIDFTAEEAWKNYVRSRTHPLSAARIETLTKRLETAAPEFAKSQPDPVRGLQQIQTLIGNFRTISAALGNEGVYDAFRRQSQTTEPRMLIPRRTTLDESQAFSGTYACTLAGPKGSISTPIAFLRSGEKVIGEYTYGGVTGRILGVVIGSKLTVDWWEGTRSGKAVFTAEPGGAAFSGTWGLGDSPTSGGTWIGKRAP